MDKEIRTNLLKDYEKVDEVIEGLLKKNSPNFYVKREHYIEPTRISSLRHLSDKEGELQYFIHIRNCIEDVLINEKTTLKVSYAPDYLKQFFE